MDNYKITSTFSADTGSQAVKNPSGEQLSIPSIKNSKEGSDDKNPPASPSYNNSELTLSFNNNHTIPISSPISPSLGKLLKMELATVDLNDFKKTSSYKKLLSIAKNYFDNLKSYPKMLRHYTGVYGPLADVAPDSRSKRSKSRMWKLGRIHTWQPEVSSLFGVLTILAAQRNGNRAHFFIKHAPGYGKLTSKRLEMTGEPPIDKRSLKEIKRDFESFKQIFSYFGPKTVGVMISASIVEALQPEGWPDQPTPAVLSPKVVSWVRKSLGPQGDQALIVTDDMNAPVFLKTYERECGRNKDGIMNIKAQRMFMLKRLIKSDVDLVLTYDTPLLQSLHLYINAGLELIKNGDIFRKEIERSVRRILKAKKRLFPDHPKLADIDATIDGMTNEELLAQKMILPGAWSTIELALLDDRKAGMSPAALKKARKQIINNATQEWIDQIKATTKLGIGGVSLEGTKSFVKRVQKALKPLKEEGFIPPFVLNNPPQEIAGFSNAGNKKYRAETKLIKKFSLLSEKLLPENIDKNALVEMIIKEVIK